jgi:hypothetical protein
MPPCRFFREGAIALQSQRFLRSWDGVSFGASFEPKVQNGPSADGTCMNDRGRWP